jgi:opacity protein-like surface antigen
MKKALLTIAVVVAALSVQAQNVRIGLTGGVNSTWLMNKNVFDYDDALDVAATFGGRFGVSAIYSFTEKVGVGIEFNFLSRNSQKYTGEEGHDYYLDGDLTTRMNYFDIPVLLRLTSTGGTYFEIGPQFGFLTKADATYEGSANSVIEDFDDFDVKNAFESTNIGLVLGFGADIDVTENIFITTGIRLGYGFTDVTKEYADEAEFLSDNPEAFPDNYVPYTTSLAAQVDDEGDQNYEKTSRVFGGLNIGVSYRFGGSSK